MFRKLIMILCCLVQVIAKGQQPGQGVFGQPVMPGPSGVYIFAIDSSKKKALADSRTVYTISREEKRNGGFKKLATLNFPASGAELERRLDKTVLPELLRYTKSSTSADLLTKLQSGKFSILGFYSLSPEVLQALGMLYIDKEVTKPDQQTGYKLEVIRNGETKLLYQYYLRDIVYTPMPQFKRYQRSASDSSVMITWYAAGGRANMGEVFRASGDKRFVNSGKMMVYLRKDTLFATYSMTTTPGENISLFMRPADVAGNTGLPSDTVNVLALSFNGVASVKKLTAADTLGGILLHWDSLPRKAYYAGIQVFKSRNANSDYIVVDTLPATATSYLDRRILTGAQYYYIVEPILYELPQGGKTAPAKVTCFTKSRNTFVSTPQGVYPSLTSDRHVKLRWDPNPEFNIFAYYVYRGTSRNNMQVISPAVRDTVYIDSVEHLSAGVTYVYAVSALDMDMHWSDTSDLVSVQSPKGKPVTPPGGLTARFTEQGVKLYWNDVSKQDATVTGYIIYKRKKGDQYFTPLTRTIIQGNYYTDSAIKAPGNYEYGCASADAWNNQSILSTLSEVTITGATYLYPPAGFNVRNLVAGIEVSIPASVNTGDNADTWIIYRRVIGSTSTPKKIGEATVSSSIFIDRQVNKSQLYAYTISRKLPGVGMESRKSEEKTIRRK